MTSTHNKIRLLITDEDDGSDERSYDSREATNVPSTHGSVNAPVEEKHNTVSSSGRWRSMDHVRIIPHHKGGGCVVTEMWPYEMAAVREAMFSDPVSVAADHSDLFVCSAIMYCRCCRFRVSTTNRCQVFLRRNYQGEKVRHSCSRLMTSVLF